MPRGWIAWLAVSGAGEFRTERSGAGLQLGGLRPQPVPAVSAARALVERIDPVGVGLPERHDTDRCPSHLPVVRGLLRPPGPRPDQVHREPVRGSAQPCALPGRSDRVGQELQQRPGQSREVGARVPEGGPAGDGAAGAGAAARGSAPRGASPGRPAVGHGPLLRDALER